MSLPAVSDKAPKLGSRWLHFKGGVYTVLATVRHVETSEELVIYGSDAAGECEYARPLKDWLKPAPNGGPRYAYIDQADENSTSESLQRGVDELKKRLGLAP